MGHEKKMLCIEIHAQKIACLNHILVLKPLQHSSVMLKAFSENTVKAIHQQQLNKCIDSAINFTMEEYVKIATEINKLNCLSNSLVIATEVMKLAVSLSYEKQRVLLGIASL